MTLPDLINIIREISLPYGWTIRTLEKGDGFLIQVVFLAEDNKTGTRTWQTCRKWYLSSHSTPTEVVRTIYKAGLAAIQHEFEETFKFRGVPIYNPHRDVAQIEDVRKDMRP